MAIEQISLDELSKLAKRGAERAQKADQDDQQRYALVGQAAHGARVLGAILEAAIGVVDTTSDAQGLSKIISTTIKKADQDANKVFSALDLDPGSVPDSVRSMWRGLLVQQLCGGISQNIGSAMRMEASAYLEPIIEHIGLAQEISPTAFELVDTSYDAKMGMALAMASSQVLAAYESFSYFYPEASEVAQAVTEHLRNTVYDGTLAELRDTYSLTDNEASYIGNALMHRAGLLMASSWSKNVPQVMDAVKQMNPEEKAHVMANGFPLNIVFDDFDNFYQGVAASVESSFEHTMRHRLEQGQTQVQDQDQKKTAGMGMSN